VCVGWNKWYTSSLHVHHSSQCEMHAFRCKTEWFDWNQLTSWSWAHLEKPPIVQLLKNFPAIYGTRRFITVFKRAIRWPLSWAWWIQSIPPHPTSIRSMLILSAYLQLGFLSGHFLSGFPTNILYAFLFLHSCYMPCPSHPTWLDYSNYICQRVQVMKLLITQFSPISRHFISLRSEYSPQQPVLKHPQSMFLP
jgi:hypothetical protein